MCHYLCVPVTLLVVPILFRHVYNASVHAFMSTWLPMSAPVLYAQFDGNFGYPCMSLFVCVPVTSCFCSHTLFRMCTCISTCIYVHLTAHICSTLLCIVWWKSVCPCMAVCLCPSHLISVPTPCLEHVHASVHKIYVHLTVHVWSTPFA